VDQAIRILDLLARERDMRIIAYLVGALDALLCARLVLRLFAARPDNPVVQALLGITAPLVLPLAFLDAQQPRFGAVLEFSTLVCLLLPLLALVVYRALHMRLTTKPQRT
jgi:uncharacterized protein YggT (Ycf19 family)